MKTKIIIAGLLILAACSKQKSDSGSGSSTPKAPSTPPHKALSRIPNPPPPTVSPNTTMVPQYNNLIRYKQKNNKSCLITSIYILVQSVKGDENYPINETGAEYYSSGEKSKKPANEEELARNNGLELKFLYHNLGAAYSTDFLNPKNPIEYIKQCEDILKKAPFILGIPLGLEGHALLVIGIDKDKQELIYVDPTYPGTDDRIKIRDLETATEVYYLP